MESGWWYYSSCYFFFFQAEDGIRDVAVTGVQTCALPISIAVRPDRIVGIEAQELLPQTVDDRSHGHRGPGVARLRRLHRVHRERADGIDGQALEVARGHDQNKKIGRAHV